MRSLYLRPATAYRLPLCLSLALATWVSLSPSPARADGPVMTDPRLDVRPVISGLNLPISMAFIGPNDFLLLQKNTGEVLRIKGGVNLGPVLDLGVNNASERGLLGIALHPNFPTTPSVFLYWTCRTDAPPTDPFVPDVHECSDANMFTTDTGNILEVPLLANRIDRFTWDGSKLTFDRNLIKIRQFQNDADPVPPGQGDEAQPARGNHDAGILAFGPDGKLYAFVGDAGRRGQLQNLPSGPTLTGLGPTVPDDQFGGPEPDDAHFAGVILRLNEDGTAPSDNPFFQAGATMGGEVGKNVQKIFAYGLRNSFGMAFDPESGNLWEEENGEDAFDELNRVEPGMNGGWIQFMGPSSRIGDYRQIETTSLHNEDFPNLQQFRWGPERIATSTSEGFARLFKLPGSHYSDPEFAWKYVVAPAAIGFAKGPGLGHNFDGDLFMGLAVPLPEGGPLFHFKLTGNRQKIAVDDPRLEDRVADNLTFDELTESESLIIGTNFGIVTDIKTGPNGNLFVVSLDQGAVYEISRRSLATGLGPLPVTAVHDHAAGPAMDMDMAAMQRQVTEWYSQHPPVGISTAAPTAVTATFTAKSLMFDADGNAATQVDTVHVNPGESVQWLLSAGIHTVTSGPNSADPSAGMLFDVPLDGTHPSFTFQFNDAGEFPFFCRTHEDFNMRGVVVVGSAVDVPQAGGAGVSTVGFASEPAPNPTTGAISFRIGLTEAGRASVRVLDARGRLVAEPLNGVLEPGLHPVSWNGRTRDGVRAVPGIYYIRLELPGYQGSRQVTLMQ